MQVISSKQFQTMFKAQKRGNKYNAKKTLIDGKKFDSASEGDLYCELKLQLRQGIIKTLNEHVREELWAYGKHICNYYVDFIITYDDQNGNEITEFIEHKGKAQDLWKLKWAMLLAKYDEQIKLGVVKCTVNWYKPKYRYIKK